MIPSKLESFGATGSNRLWKMVAGLAIVCILLMACSTVPVDTINQTATPFLAKPSPTKTATATLNATAMATPQPTSKPLTQPTPPANGVSLVLSPNPNRIGWLASNQVGISHQDVNLRAGTFQGESFASIFQFDLQSLPPGSKILFAALEITERSTTNLENDGQWVLSLIDSNHLDVDTCNYDSLTRISPLLTWNPPSSSLKLAEGLTNRFIFDQRDLGQIQKQLDQGLVSFRLTGANTPRDNLIVWNANPGLGGPTLYLVVIPAPLTIVTNTPTPPNIFAAATLVAQQTVLARERGSPTPLPRSYVTTTPVPEPFVITLVPTPINTAARTATAVYATAVAATTGTFTPIPSNWVTATPRPLLIPRELISPVPTPTHTPIPVDLIALAKKPLPSVLYNKIMFLEGPRANPNIWVMDPDGSNVQLLTDHQYFDIAKTRDTFSPDGSKWVYQWPDGYGHTQLWVTDLNYPNALPVEITFGGSGGVVFGQAWSPDGKKIAYTADTIERQEIWVFTFPNTPKRLTFSTGWYWNQFPSWSPDSKRIVFSSDYGHNAKFSEIWVMDEDGRNWEKLGNGTWDCYNPVWVKWRQ
jgi:hypothetical protein